MSISRKEGKPSDADSLDDLMALIEKLRAPETFNEAENVRQNLQWYAEERMRKERKRAIHNAICELRGKTAAEQHQWLENQEDSAFWESALRPYLHLEIIVEQINKDTEEARRLKSSLDRKKKPCDPEVFLARALGQGRCLRASELLKKAARSGISERTLYRAKAKLHVQSERRGFGTSGYFVWFLPPNRGQ